MEREEGRQYLSAVKIGPKGQIVIPKEVREMFGIAPGDTMVLMADTRRGIALQTADAMRRMVEGGFAAAAPDGADHSAFTKLIRQVLKGEEA